MKDYCFKIFNLKTSQQFFLLLMFFLMQSCEEDMTKVNKGKKTNFASQIIHNANIIQRDSGVVKVRFKAPLLESYELIDSPYVEAKKGIYLEFFDKKNPKVPGKVWAKYAKNNIKRDSYFAKGRVKIITTEGQTFVTETINWDKRNKKMYTKDTVFVSDKDGNILVGAHGMVAKDDFSEYTFFNNSGSFNSTNLPATSK
ncbi:MAG: LPS export ABC transporter periplasmic protein LptC [Chryseobacterium sp.]|uniref:LPS export ABC transporter protein LptC n=2 Tax=Epilithonimonas xixisoli TaxID=1476462 RepID=A0A4R8I7Z7_9FLAO|nr:LPS export ABC transporter periplasmic protein LptC [Chryseobacterium sp.]MBP7501055.1 LPS export ABC transporter periplasmic protein LptC [Chryseobacterium sp.]TDX86132.1 LPS export ABC transporter protein LptC [Epilithonimonas xixisoli]